MTEETGTAEVVEAEETETTDTESTADEDGQNVEPETAESEESEGDEESPEGKTFSQEELDQIVEKRLARQERKIQRQQDSRLQSLQSQIEALTKALNPDGGSDADGFDSSEPSNSQAFPDDFYETRDNVIDEVEEKYPDVDLELFSVLPVTNVMAEDITYSDHAPELVKYLTENPKEAVRISKLPARKQTAEIGKLEAKVSQPAPKPKTTGAPAPAKPVKGKTSTKPRYYEGMPQDEYIRKRREDIENSRKRVI